MSASAWNEIRTKCAVRLFGRAAGRFRASVLNTALPACLQCCASDQLVHSGARHVIRHHDCAGHQSEQSGGRAAQHTRRQSAAEANTRATKATWRAATSCTCGSGLTRAGHAQHAPELELLVLLHGCTVLVIATTSEAEQAEPRTVGEMLCSCRERDNRRQAERQPRDTKKECDCSSRESSEPVDSTLCCAAMWCDVLCCAAGCWCWWAAA